MVHVTIMYENQMRYPLFFKWLYIFVMT